MLFWIKEAIFGFVILGLHEAYWKEWSIKVARFWVQPLLDTAAKAKILPRVDELIIEKGQGFVSASQDAILETGIELTPTQLDDAVYEVAQIFDIDILKAKKGLL